MTRVVLLPVLVILLAVSIHSHQHSHETETGHSHGHSHESPSYKYSAEANKKPSEIDPHAIWTDVIMSVLLISIAPVIVLYFIPDLASRSGLLKILLGFAAGGLLGDAFLHLIPHSLEQMISLQKTTQANHGHSHSLDTPQMRVGCYVLIGILIFLFIEKLLLSFSGNSGHSHDKKAKGGKKQEKSIENDDEHHFKISAFLNLIADFTHNFTDGLAIGASYLVNRNVGMVTTATVLFHELPHEIGDYAILMQSGYSRRKAMCLQLLTAIGALIGAALSLISAGVNLGFSTKSVTKESLEMTSRGILPITAGGFIYIAMVTVMPSLLKKSSQSSFLQNFAEILALFSGIGLMVLVSLFE